MIGFNSRDTTGLGMLVGGALLALAGVGLLIYSLGRFIHIPLADDPMTAMAEELDRDSITGDLVWLTFLGIVLIGSGYTMFQRGWMRWRIAPGGSGLSDDYLTGYGRGDNPTVEHTFGHEQETTHVQEETTTESREMRPCPGCGHENAEGARFCGQCGDVLPAEKVCTDCDRRYPPEAMFCVTCGRRLGPPPLR